MKWEYGRQGGGYRRLTLFQFPFLDCHILHCPEGSSIKKHVDKLPGRCHYRANILLKGPKEGGEFLCNEAFINTKRLKFFCPDIALHEVTKVEKGSRYMLSIGFSFKDPSFRKK